ncbi:MAG: glutamate 5-kinase [Nitrospirae bacterium]|nr:MAG: glutamate 5-kinase [Nitrospirota bacterium]
MKCIVLKIGSNIIASPISESGLDMERIYSIARDVSDVMNHGYSFVIVSSGAVAAGKKKLGIKKNEMDIKLKQAAAAAGQSSLVNAYEMSFREYNKRVAQILLTADDISERKRYINARNTMMTLLEMGVVPIVNENDTVAFEEIKFGDNDNLAAIVSGLIDADMLVILSDVEGLYTCDPKKDSSAELIKEVEHIDKNIESMAGSSLSTYGTGGMYSKLLSAKKANMYGIGVVIMSGRVSGLLKRRIIYKEEVGTYFKPKGTKLSLRKRWLTHGLRDRGSIYIDRGAVEAIVKKKKSLLPSGIVGVSGDFGVGDLVSCVTEDGLVVAKGLTNYSSSDIDKIKGCKSSDIEEILGFKYADEVIHRDNLVVL